MRRRSQGHGSIRGLFRNRDDMKRLLNSLGKALMVIGTIWFFQGINVLPGSLMTGQIQWAVYGGIAFAVGVVCLVLAKRR